MKLYLVRHGQTRDAQQDLKQGPESVLSDDGKKQAKRTGRLLADKGIEIILASPWARAKETAEIINQTLKKELIFEDMYRERKQPETLTGRSRMDKEVRDYEIQRENNFLIPDWKYNGMGETWEETFERAKNIEKLLMENYMDKTVLAVSHADFLRCLITHLLIGDNFESPEFKKFFRALGFKNGGIFLVFYDKDRSIWRMGNFD